MSKKVLFGVLLVMASSVLVHNHGRAPSLPSLDVPIMKARTKATMDEKRENKALTISYARALGYDQNQIRCLVSLWTRESRFDHLARPRDSQGKPTSSAYGIAQLLRERSSEPELQVLHGIRYITHRYSGSACRALSHSDRRGWY